MIELHSKNLRGLLKPPLHLAMNRVKTRDHLLEGVRSVIHDTVMVSYQFKCHDSVWSCGRSEIDKLFVFDLTCDIIDTLVPYFLTLFLVHVCDSEVPSEFWKLVNYFPSTFRRGGWGLLPQPPLRRTGLGNSLKWQGIMWNIMFLRMRTILKKLVHWLKNY